MTEAAQLCKNVDSFAKLSTLHASRSDTKGQLAGKLVMHFQPHAELLFLPCATMKTGKLQ